MLRGWSRLVGVALVLMTLVLAAPASAEAPRLALVVGNAAYPTHPLATSANDAALVAQALAQTGFDVTAAMDLDGAGLRAAFRDFAEAAQAAGPQAVVVVYLAGYGVQYDDNNYMAPVDAHIVHDDDVPTQAVNLDDFASALSAVSAKARLLVYDLARANPFAADDEMPLAAGLAPSSAAKDTLVAFNAAPGMVAPDNALPYGAYARALAEMIGTPGLTANALFDRVRLRVGELTDGAQVPWDDGAISGDLALLPSSDTPAGTARSIDAIPVDALSPDVAYAAVVARDSLAGYSEFVRAFPDGPLSTRIRALLTVRREALIWQAAVQSDNPRATWTYMRRYPRGPHRFDARRRLATLHAALEPPPRFDVVAFPNLPPPSALELKMLASPQEATAGLAPIPPAPAALLPASDNAYYDALPPPAPAPAGLLPIAPPLPRAALPPSDAGRVIQSRPGKGLAVLEPQFAADGGATVTLADTEGPIAELTATTGTDGMRTFLELNAKDAILSRATVARSADGLTILQTGANGGILYEIATRADPDGTRFTRVTDGHGEVLASWRRDTQGITVAREVAPVASVAAKRETAPTPKPLGAQPPRAVPNVTPLPPTPPAMTAHAPAPPQRRETSAGIDETAKPTVEPRSSAQTAPAGTPPLPPSPTTKPIAPSPARPGPLTSAPEPPRRDHRGTPAPETPTPAPLPPRRPVERHEERPLPQARTPEHPSKRLPRAADQKH